MRDAGCRIAGPWDRAFTIRYHPAANNKMELRVRTFFRFAGLWKRRAKRMAGMGMLLALLPLQACVLSESISGGEEPRHATSWLRPADAQDEIGQREHPIVLAKYGGEYRDDNAEALLALIVGKLVAVSDDKSRIYKITILNTPKVNAFALPGGYLYVTRGLMALANDTAELAAVIAHEMAHVSANHAILRGKKEQSGRIGEEVVSEVLGTSVAGQVALAANQMRLSEFSQDQELQADAIGIRMLGQAGYDAHGAARFLETMQSHHALQSGASSRFADISFMSSHPTTPRRVELARKHARFFGAPGHGEADRDRYMKGIDGLLYGDSAEEGFVRGNRFAHTGLGITFEAPRNASMENKATAVVVNGPGDLATRFDAAILPRGMTLEAYLDSGWVNGLDAGSIRTETLNGLPAASARARSQSWDFVIRVIQMDRQVYRFITAGPINDARIADASSEVAGSFRRLNESEKAQLKPLRLRVVRVAQGDSLSTLAGRMAITENKLRTFQVLNGLRPGEIPEPGSLVKIVAP